MKNTTHKSFPWALSLFPVLQCAAFAACLLLLGSYTWMALVSLALAALLMGFNIHIFLHECVHYSNRYSLLFNYLCSILIGLPFDGYRLHHYNHHYYENGPGDFSTTWIYSSTGRQPRGIWSYAFGWHRQLLASLNCLTPYDASDEHIAVIKQRTRSQKRFLALFMLILFVINWHLLLLYLSLIYFGWFFTALHNYGQHPPDEDNQIRTFAHPLYNKLFFNNGLHWEHHHYPSLAWYELHPSELSQRIHTVHLLHPILQQRS